jgi:hypothetical protein
MRNRINASDINVVVDRNDRAVVAGIKVLHGLPTLAPSASYPRAGAGATKPGLKCLGTGSRHQLQQGSHHAHLTCAMQERLPQTWRSRRSFTTASRRSASIG